jgi:hypothetical protein
MDADVVAAMISHSDAMIANPQIKEVLLQTIATALKIASKKWTSDEAQ